MTGETAGATATPPAQSDFVDAAAVAAARAAGEDVFLCEYTYDAHFQRFKRRTEWEDDEFSDDEGQGRTGRLVRGEERYVEDDEFELDEVDDTWGDGEGGGTTGTAGRQKKGKGLKSGKGKQKKASALENRKKGRAVSRHICASRRKAAAASGETGVMGLGAMSVPKVERQLPTTKLGAARVALSLAATPVSISQSPHSASLFARTRLTLSFIGIRGRCRAAKPNAGRFWISWNKPYVLGLSQIQAHCLMPLFDVHGRH